MANGNPTVPRAVRSRSIGELMNDPSNDAEIDELLFGSPAGVDNNDGHLIPNSEEGGGDLNAKCGGSRRGGGTGHSSGGGGGGSPGNNGGSSSNGLYFKDCGGLEKQVGYIKTAVIDPLSGKNTSGVKRFGLEAPKGILFYGPPGTGKTRLAQALGNEIKNAIGRPVHFIYRKGQDVASKYFGQSSENLRRVFEEAKERQPSVIFFDELDGLCPRRDGAHVSQANVSIVTTMLGLMDELPKGKVFVIGATNRLESIDPALRRPGRFDKHLEFLPPSEAGRLEILRIHTRAWKVKPSVEVLTGLTRDTVGYSGADLAKLCLDAFDNALNRAIQDADGDFNSPKLKDLNVEKQDWVRALGKMKPTNAAVFGSTLYTPSAGIGDHVAPLLESNVNNIVKAVTDLLPLTKSITPHSSILSIHVSDDSDSVLGNLDEYAISEALRSPQLAKYTIYSISSSTLSSTPKNSWGTKINDAFTQALNSPQSSILYLPQTHELWNMLKSAKLGFALNLTQELERLRGKFVLLLTTGPPPSSLSADNPLKKVIVGSANNYEVEPPSEDDRNNFFTPVFSYALALPWTWSNDQIVAHQLAFEKAVEYTEDKGLGSMLQLHDQLNQTILITKHNSINDLLSSIMQVVGHFGMNHPSPANGPNGDQ